MACICGQELLAGFINFLMLSVVCAAVTREPCPVLTNAHRSSLLKEQHRYFSHLDGRYGKSWSLMETDDSLGRKLR